MRSERRHELQQNLLADWLAQTAKKVKPYANVVLVVAAAALVVLVGRMWIDRHASAAATDAWDNLFAAFESRNPANLDLVAEAFADTEVAAWANTLAGDLRSAQGCSELFRSRDTGMQELQKAVTNYLAALDEGGPPALRERSTFGLARAYEAQGGLDKAVETYQRIEPGGCYAEAAKRRLADLARPATKRFYARFANFDPKPAFQDEPGTPGQRLDYDPDSLRETEQPSDSFLLPRVDLGSPKPSKPEAKTAAGQEESKSGVKTPTGLEESTSETKAPAGQK